MSARERKPEGKRWINSMHWFTVILASLWILLMASCEKAAEGCRDLRAINFNARAELDCEDCCNYPDLSISIGYRVFDSLLVTSKYYPLLNGDSIKFLEQGFFLSDFALETPSGIYRAGDMLTTRSRSGSLVTFEDDHLLCQLPAGQRSLSFWLGPEYNEVPKTLSFNLGLESPKSEVNALLLIGSNPLIQSQGSAWYDSLSGYTHQRWVLQRWPQSDTLRLSQKGGASTVKISIPWPQNRKIFPGEKVDVVLKVDLGAWVQGIDFRNSAPSDIIEMLKTSAQGAFAIQ